MLYEKCLRNWSYKLLDCFGWYIIAKRPALCPVRGASETEQGTWLNHVPNTRGIIHIRMLSFTVGDGILMMSLSVDALPGVVFGKIHLRSSRRARYHVIGSNGASLNVVLEAQLQSKSVIQAHVYHLGLTSRCQVE